MTESGNPLRSLAATEAADWYARLRAPDLSELDAARFRAWLAGDHERRREFDAIDAFWEGLGAIEHSPEVTRARQEIQLRRRRKATSSIGRDSAKLWRIAAALLVTTGAALLGWRQMTASTFATDIGEQRTVQLADGSLLTLNTDSKVRLHYTERERGIELLRGQANFEVAKDAARPFIVRAGGGAVRALGTVFDVCKVTDTVTVTLIEGKIAVTPVGAAGSAAPPRAEIVLAAGEQLSYTAAFPPKRAVADLRRVNAWRSRKLDFSDTPLVDAIAEANRYSRNPIVLEAPHLTGARISGTFEAGRNDLLAEGLTSYFRLKAEHDSDRIILTESPD